MPYRVLVVGPGALGRALGGLLEKGGAEVAYCGRKGLPLPVCGGCGIELPEPDLVLVTTKAYDTALAIRGAGRFLGHRAPVLSLQNGGGNISAIHDCVRDDRILGGSTTHAARRRADGTVEHVASGETRIAPLAASALPVARTVAAELTRHGLETTVEENLVRLLWRKAAISSGVNGVTALEACPNGALLERPAALARAIAAARETLEVGRDMGIPVDPAEAEALVRSVCERTAANRSSMLQDLEAGRRTEVNEIHGSVVERARQVLGREAPVNEALMRDIQEREKVLAHA